MSDEARRADERHAVFHPPSFSVRPEPSLTVGLQPRTYFLTARAAVRAALGVEGATGGAAVVHRAREPVGDDGARGEYDHQDEDAQERVFQPLCLSRSSLR